MNVVETLDKLWLSFSMKCQAVLVYLQLKFLITMDF